MSSSKSVAVQVRTQWERLKGVPGGKRLFSWALGRSAPYTGTIGAIVDELEPGYAKVRMHDRKRVRNHLDCVHAIALMNLGEVTSGLAVLSGMPDDARGILAGLSMEYHKKGRGTLTAECRCSLPETSERTEYQIVAEIRDTAGDLVATATARWLIGPMKKAEEPSSSEAAA